jgi:excisionase family DNA binding protein
MSKTERETYLSTRELMEMLSISRSTVHRMIAKGLPNIMVGSVHRFSLDQVIAWLERRTTGGSAKDREQKRDHA